MAMPRINCACGSTPLWRRSRSSRDTLPVFSTWPPLLTGPWLSPVRLMKLSASGMCFPLIVRRSRPPPHRCQACSETRRPSDRYVLQVRSSPHLAILIITTCFVKYKTLSVTTPHMSLFSYHLLYSSTKKHCVFELLVTSVNTAHFTIFRTHTNNAEDQPTAKTQHSNTFFSKRSLKWNVFCNEMFSTAQDRCPTTNRQATSSPIITGVLPTITKFMEQIKWYVRTWPSEAMQMQDDGISLRQPLLRCVFSSL